MSSTLNTNRQVVTSVNGQAGDVVLGKYHKYTVRWNQKEPQMTRENDAAAITLDTKNFGHFGSVNPNYDNPFDKIYPWSGRKLCNIDIEVYMDLKAPRSLRECVVAWEGDPDFDYMHKYGVWVYTPEFWGKTWFEGEDRLFEISDADIPGENYIYYPESIDGRYYGVEKTLEIKGEEKELFLPLTYGAGWWTPLPDAIRRVKNYNASVGNAFSRDKETLLYLVEYANTCSKSIFGESGNYYISGAFILVNDASVGDTVLKFTVSENIDFETEINAALTNIPENTICLWSSPPRTVKKVDISTEDKLLTVTLRDPLLRSYSAGSNVNGYATFCNLANIKDAEIGSKSGKIYSPPPPGRSWAEPFLSYYRGQVDFINQPREQVVGAYTDEEGYIWLYNTPQEALDNGTTLDREIAVNTGIQYIDKSGYISKIGAYPSMISALPFATETNGDSKKPVGANASTCDRGTVLGMLFGGEDNMLYVWNNSLTSNGWFNYACRPILLPPR